MRPVIGGTAEHPARVDLALLHPGRGIALVDLAPRTTAHAVTSLRRVLDAARLPARHPGSLPITYCRLAPGEVSHLPHLLDVAFAAEPPLTVADAGWTATVRALLEAGPTASRAKGGRSPGAAIVAAALLLWVGGGGLAVLGRLGPAAEPRLGAVADGVASPSDVALDADLRALPAAERQRAGDGRQRFDLSGSDAGPRPGPVGSAIPRPDPPAALSGGPAPGAYPDAMPATERVASRPAPPPAAREDLFVPRSGLEFAPHAAPLPAPSAPLPDAVPEPEEVPSSLDETPSPSGSGFAVLPPQGSEEPQDLRGDAQGDDAPRLAAVPSSPASATRAPTSGVDQGSSAARPDPAPRRAAPEPPAARQPANPRCAAILARLQLGETPSHADRSHLDAACASRR
jgi:hypothetical protein